MRSSSIPLLPAAKPMILHLTVLLLAALPLSLAPAAHACPPSPVGLAVLIEDAEQAVYVEILDVEQTPLRWLQMTARRLRTVAVKSSEFVSQDLALMAEVYLPEVEVEPEWFHYRATAEVLAVLNPASADVGSSIGWPLKTWFGRGVLPGRRAVVFLGRRPKPYAFLGLTVTDHPDSVLVLGEHQDPGELTALIKAGFANKRAGKVATEEWLTTAVESPTCRVFLSHRRLTERLAPSAVADALVQNLTGTFSDHQLLRSLRQVSRTDLDLLSLDLAASWLEADHSPYHAAEAVFLALERWQIPISSSLEKTRHSWSVEELRGFWLDISREHALPTTGDPHLNSQIASWRRMLEESQAFRQTLLADGFE